MKLSLIAAATSCLLSFCAIAQKANKWSPGEWPNYGNDAGGMRYANLDQVNTQNISKLEVAWIYRTGELETYAGTDAHEKAAFEATPLMVDRTLYFSTPTSRVFAIDAGTGKHLWSYDPKIDRNTDYSEITSRGVSYWQKRVFVATIDGRLIALDSKSGELISSFGNNGTVNLREGYNNEWSITSPPAICGNVIVVGSSMGDNQRIDYPKGTVRGFDASSGKLLWSWDPITPDSSYHPYPGAANAWAVISADPERDLVFIPTSSPAPDFYGGFRPGQNLYGNSLVALKASTGKMAWHFQVVHHDLWDYDIAAQPVLIELNKTPAVVIGTKMGHVFVLNRETGKPIFPVEERPVPASFVRGEEAWKTQPFPVMPKPLGIQQFSPDDAWGLTEKDKEEAKQKISRYRNEGIFTPPGREGSLMIPGNVGGIHWGGMCYDPKKNLLVTNINRIPAIITLIERDSIASFEKNNPHLMRSETGWQKGTPYIMKREYLFKLNDSNQIRMQSKPPWGTLLAIDLNSGEKKWETPFGYMLDPKKYPEAENWGSINFGGAIVTAGGLTFVAASVDDNIRAFDTQTGELLWKHELPAGGQATPMSYSVAGKQYIVIAAGGHGKLMTKLGDYVVAFAIK